jgi:hypothetical protein
MAEYNILRAIDAYERVLASLNKEEAPAILISDFNYFWNKATIHYINVRYNLYDTNQQTTDDLSTLVKSDLLTPDMEKSPIKTLYPLPDDYLHLLRCEVYFAKKPTARQAKCVPNVKNLDLLPSWIERNKYVGTIVKAHTRRATSEIYSGAEQNYYFRPALDNPYHFIRGSYNAEDGPKQILEIRAGNSIGKNPLQDEIISVKIEYLRKPKEITLTRQQIKGESLSQILEFPDYVINEIINLCTILLAEKGSDPRLQTIIPTHQTIPSQPASPQ